MKRLIVAMAFACATAYVGLAGEWTVAQDGSGDYTTIQDAIDAETTKAGDTIWVKPGVMRRVAALVRLGTGSMTARRAFS